MKTTLKLIWAAITISTFISCSKKPAPAVYDYEVYKTQDILLAEEDRGGYLNFYSQIVNIDGKDVIIKINGQHLSFYELENGEKTHDIFIDSLSYIWSCDYVGKDSIFISCSTLERDIELESPQALRLIDWEGNVKKIYGYDIDQEELKNYKYDANKLVPPQDNFVFCNGSVIFNSTYYFSYDLLGTKESVENPLPLGIRMDTKENKYHVSKHRKFAYIKQGMYYPTYHSIIVRKSANNLPLFRYPYSSSVFEWDFEQDNVIEHYFKSALVDSIMPLQHPTERGYEISYDYGAVKYDEFNQVHVGIIYFNEQTYGANKHGLIFADKNFQYLGEMYDYKHFPLISNKDMALSVRRKNDSVLTISYLKLIKTNIDYDTYIDSCKNILQAMKQNVENRKKALQDGCPSVNFVKSQMEIKESSYKILTLYGEGCIGCDMVTLQTLYFNREVLNKVPLYIIVSNTNPSEYMQKYELTYYDKVVIDSTCIMKNVANNSRLLNPRITIVEDGVITLDTIYQALDIEDKLLPQITGPNEYSKYALDENGEVIITFTH